MHKNEKKVCIFMKFYFLPPPSDLGIRVEKINHPSFQCQCFFHFQKLMTPLLLHPLPNSFRRPWLKGVQSYPIKKKAYRSRYTQGIKMIQKYLYSPYNFT